MPQLSSVIPRILRHQRGPVNGSSGGPQGRLIMVGAFPPPLHGMAAVNVAIRDEIRKAGIEPEIVNLAATSLRRSLIARLSRVPRVARGLSHLLLTTHLTNATLYMSVSGGLGQVYDVLFVLLSRARGIRLFLHHHSYAYVERPSLLTAILVRAAGKAACHVTQSAGMSARLAELYGAGTTAWISNAAFLLEPESGTRRQRCSVETLGFISNISEEKGVFDFLDLIAIAGEAGHPIHGRIAGPFQDENTERRVRQYLSALPNVSYEGPKYGVDKDEFFSSIDVLVFPTRYRNETEGIVNHEAMSRGIPVIAYGRGCIPEFVESDCGLVVRPEQEFVPVSLAQIEAWLTDPESFERATVAAAQRFKRTVEESRVHLRDFVDELTRSDCSRTQTLNPSSGRQ
jgi:glycosyltransferase involved in cell wall biosynthesis